MTHNISIYQIIRANTGDDGIIDWEGAQTELDSLTAPLFAVVNILNDFPEIAANNELFLQHATLPPSKRPRVFGEWLVEIALIRAYEDTLTDNDPDV